MPEGTDVVFHVAAVDKGRPCAPYILARPATTLPQVSGEIARLLGIKPMRTISPFLLRLMGRPSVMGAAVTGKPPLMTPEKANNFSKKPAELVSDVAIAELGYEEVPLETCARDCYDRQVVEGLLY
jgi:hypothetical protein